MRKGKVKLIKAGKYVFDDAAVRYSKLSDEEAKDRVKALKDQIQDLKELEHLGKKPEDVYKLRDLYNALAWFRQNKNRSKFFKVETLGASMRRAKRHPLIGSLESSRTNNAKSCKRKQQNRSKRKAVQVPVPVRSLTRGEDFN